MDERLSVPEIATRVGVHRNALYARFRKNGIALRALSKPELLDFYDNQKLTIIWRSRNGQVIIAILLRRTSINMKFLVLTDEIQN